MVVAEVSSKALVTPLTSMLRTSLLTNSSTSATQIAVKYNEVYGGGDKLVEKSSKVEKPQNSEKLQRSSVRRNVYQSTGPLSTKNSSFR